MGSAEAISSEEHFILQVARPRKKSPPRADSEKIFPLRGLQIAKKSCPIKSSTEKFIHGVLKILLHAPRSTFHVSRPMEHETRVFGVAVSVGWHGDCMN